MVKRAGEAEFLGCGKRRSEFFQTLALGLTLLGIGLFTHTPFRFGRPAWWLGDAWTFLAPLLAIAGSLVICLALSLVAGEWNNLYAYSIIGPVLLIVAACWIFGHEDDMVRIRFRTTSALRLRAVDWVSKQTLKDHATLELPSEIAPLTFGRHAIVRKSESGETLVFFEHYRNMPDNAEGLVWSATGLEPGQNSFWEVHVVRRLDGHWFWIQTT